MLARDREVLRWIEDYRAITIRQATQFFFDGCYGSCKRRLKQLEDMELLKSYTSKLTKEKIYYFDKRLSDHDLLVYDFIKVITQIGGKLVKLVRTPHYLNNLLIPDAFIIFDYEDSRYFILLEVDYTHYTNNSKFQLYEKLYRDNVLQQQCYNTFPIVVVARPSKGIRYNSKNFEVIYTDLNYQNLKDLLFE